MNNIINTKRVGGLSRRVVKAIVPRRGNGKYVLI